MSIMTFLDAILLGFIEGVTEFLPISSTGHLILASRLLQIPQSEFTKSFEIAIQLGAILAVAALYGRSLLLDRAVLLRVCVAFVPTGVVGFALYRVFRQYLIASEALVLWALLLGGVFLILFERFHRTSPSAEEGIERMTLRQAFLIGCFQSAALVPGISRAAATIVGGLLLGLPRRTIVTFSFLLAIPTMVAATGYDLLKTAPAFSAGEFALLATGFVTSFFVALLVIRWFLGYVQNRTFEAFGWYRVVLAILFWAGLR